MISFTGEELDKKTYKFLKRVTNKALRMLGQNPWRLEICVDFVYDQEMAEINARTRNINEPTDVLSYPNLENVFNKKVNKKNFPNEVSPETHKIFLGDIVINLDRVKEQANSFGHSEDREMCYLLVHGILHILGYDHIDELDKSVMRAQEERILAKFNLKRA